MPYTVRLHFADLTNDHDGKRVFDVKLQNRVVLKGFDIFAQAGGRNRAVVKEFRGIMATDTLELAFAPGAGEMTTATAPIISGMQVVAEKPVPVPPPVKVTMTGGKGSAGFILLSDMAERLADKAPKKQLEKKPKRREKPE